MSTRPTLADVPLPPRRALRDGAPSRSSSSSSSRGSSVSRPRGARRGSHASLRGADDVSIEPARRLRPLQARVRHDALDSESDNVGTSADETVDVVHGPSNEPGPSRRRKRSNDDEGQSEACPAIRIRGAAHRRRGVDSDVDELHSGDDEEEVAYDGVRYVRQVSTNSPIDDGGLSIDNAHHEFVDLAAGYIDDDDAEVDPEAAARACDRHRHDLPPRALPDLAPDFGDDLESLKSVSSLSPAPADRPDIITISSSSSLDAIGPDTNTIRLVGAASERRYTAAEKGKGRANGAVEAIEVSDGSSDEEEDTVQQQLGEIQEEHVPSEGGLQTYACPICFCSPNQPALTSWYDPPPPGRFVHTPANLSGHLFCRTCLHSAMLAAIARSVNPYPPRMPARHNRRKLVFDAHHQPSAWTYELLVLAYGQYLDGVARRQALETGLALEDVEAVVEAQREGREVDVEQVLKGLWKIGGEGLAKSWVVEGECPVCRKTIPGGFGLIEAGIGGVVFPRVSLGQRRA
ncbi:hypothetical protein Q5752_005857 [Cryptotrichosporon argae]